MNVIVLLLKTAQAESGHKADKPSIRRWQIPPANIQKALLPPSQFIAAVGVADGRREKQKRC
jgi:hypothetical protein